MERRALLLGLPLRVRLIVRFLYASGTRVSEALGVKRTDCIQDGEGFTVRLHGKGRKERLVRIPARLKGEIDAVFGERAQGGTPLFLFETLEAKPYSRTYVWREVARAARRVLGRKISPHDMRHSRATDLYRATHNLKGVRDLLGHNSITTTEACYVTDGLTDAELFNDDEL